VESTVGALHRADALLVVGSSLMVYSGFRYCRIAAEHGIPIATAFSHGSRGYTPVLDGDDIFGEFLFGIEQIR